MGSTEQLWEAKEIRRRLEEESGGRYCRYFLAAKGIEMSVCRRTQLDCGRPAELLLLLLLDQMLRRAATASQQHLTHQPPLSGQCSSQAFGRFAPFFAGGEISGPKRVGVVPWIGGAMWEERGWWEEVWEVGDWEAATKRETSDQTLTRASKPSLQDYIFHFVGVNFLFDQPSPKIDD